MAIISIHGKIGSGKDETGNIIRYLTSQTYQNKLTYEYWNIKGEELQQSPFEIKKFGGKLKDTICLWLNCTREQLEDREFKNKELGPEWDKWLVQDWNPDSYQQVYYSSESKAKFSITEDGENSGFYKPTIKKVPLTPRKLLQILGTEAGRDIIHPDLWCILLFTDYVVTGGYSDGPHFPNWVITDNRFVNEIERIKREGGITIKIERPMNLRFPKAWKDFDVSADKDYPRTEDNFLQFLKISNWEPYRELYKTLTHFSETALDNYEYFDYIVNNDGDLEHLITQIKNILTKENLLKE